MKPSCVTAKEQNACSRNSVQCVQKQVKKGMLGICPALSSVEDDDFLAITKMNDNCYFSIHSNLLRHSWCLNMDAFMRRKESKRCIACAVHGSALLLKALMHVRECKFTHTHCTEEHLINHSEILWAIEGWLRAAERGDRAR